ncbi:unnamed protein product [Gordionus sp. m RMFG-2023]
MILLKASSPQIFPSIDQTHRIRHKSHARLQPELPLEQFVPKKVYCKTSSLKDLTIMLGSAFNPRYMSINKPSMYMKAKSNPIVPSKSSIKDFVNDGEFRLTDEDQDDFLPFVVSSHYTKDLARVSNKKEIKRDTSSAFSLSTHKKAQTNSTIISLSKLAQSLSYNNESTRRPKRNKRSHYQTANKTRGRRYKHSPIFSLPKSASFKPWECKSKVIWKDLGPDYFPRYLRTIECTSKKCFYSFYNCVPKAFTVKILKRDRKELAGFSCIDLTQDESHYEVQYKLTIEDEVVDYNTFLGDDKLQNEFEEKWIFEERAVVFCCDCGYS